MAGCSWLNHPTNLPLLQCHEDVDRRTTSLRIRTTSSMSCRNQSSLVHCGSWKNREFIKPWHEFQIHGTVVAAATFTDGIQQAQLSSLWNLPQSRHHLRDSATGEDNHRSTRNVTRRIKVYLNRNVDVAFHSEKVNLSPGLQPPFWNAIGDVVGLRRSVPIPGTRWKRWEAGVGAGEDLPATYQEENRMKELPQRRCGILLHPTSLPGPHGIGDLGDGAYTFLDWLKGTGCTLWQVLPLVPPGRRGGEDGSPYAGADANCGNTLLISLERLVRDGLLEETDLPAPVPVKRMNYTKVAAVKDPLVMKAAANLVAMRSGKLKQQLQTFRTDPNIAAWLEEAALFAAIDQATKATTWWKWPSHLRDRDPNAMKGARKEHKVFIDSFVAAQFLFQRQWQEVHRYANEAGIRILGDMPIYVGGHSADVWAHRELFDLDPKTGAPASVSGVPPDAFSATGQLWGSPLYNWKEMAKGKYAWWATRLRRAYELYDEFRIDHFRGFAGYWAVPATASSAMRGKWKAGPGKAFFTAMREAVRKKIDIVAEDLGVITSDVVALRRDVHAPGMAVLQFAYDVASSDEYSRNPHLPHNHEFDQVVYPGTHDNDTTLGWWQKATEPQRALVKKYLRFSDEDEVHWEFIRAATASVAKTAIISMQDVMGLDNCARMNIPATQAGNWGWRLGESDAFQTLRREQTKLRKFLCRYNRLTSEFVEHWKQCEKENSNELEIVAEEAKPEKEKGEDEKKGKGEKDKVKKSLEAMKGPFEKLKETLKEKAVKPFEKLKETAKAMILKDDGNSQKKSRAKEKLPKEKEQDNVKPPGKENNKSGKDNNKLGKVNKK